VATEKAQPMPTEAKTGAKSSLPVVHEEVGDDDDGSSFVGPLSDLVPEVHIGAVVEPLVGLVEQQHLRVVDEGERQVEFLALAAGQVLGGGGVGAVEAEHVEHLVDPLPSGGRVCGSRRQQLQVFVGREQVDQTGLLWAPSERTVDSDRAAVGGGNAGADVHEGRLAGAVFTDERQRFAGLQREVGAPQHLFGAVGLLDSVGVKHRFLPQRPAERAPCTTRGISPP